MVLLSLSHPPLPTPPADLALEHLEHQITELAGNLHAGTCRWLLLIGEFDRRAGWASWGAKSCSHWLSYRCGVAPSAAREHVRVARSLEELTEIRDAFATGELSYSKVRALTRVATEATEHSLVEIARHSTAAQLEKVVRAYRNATSADLEAANLAHARRFLSWSWEDDGTLSIRGRLSAEDGAAFIAAVDGEALADLLSASAEAPAMPPDLAAPGADAALARRASAEAARRRQGVGGPPDEDAAEDAEQPIESGRGARAADALVRLVQGDARPGAGQVVLHVDDETLCDDDCIHDCCEVADGPAVPPETARRLSCDASVIVMREREGKPFDVGRRTRSIPPALRRALERRDRECRFPGCHSPHRLHAHHVVHWARGGATDLENLVLICPFHHRLVHEGGFGLARTGDELVFFRPDGRPISAVPLPTAGASEGLAAANERAGTDIDADSCVSLWTGEPLDLHWTVMTLCDREGRADRAA